jgi:hypothetical protein
LKIHIHRTLNDIIKMHVREAAGLDDESSIPSRTVLTFTCSIKTGGKWKAQPAQEIGLLETLADPTVADLYWCGVLKFQRDLLLTTPSDVAMSVMLRIPAVAALLAADAAAEAASTAAVAATAAASLSPP